jgi:hypothetical protein
MFFEWDLLWPTRRLEDSILSRCSMEVDRGESLGNGRWISAWKASMYSTTLSSTAQLRSTGKSKTQTLVRSLAVQPLAWYNSPRSSSSSSAPCGCSAASFRATRIAPSEPSAGFVQMIFVPKASRILLRSTHKFDGMQRFTGKPCATPSRVW